MNAKRVKFDDDTNPPDREGKIPSPREDSNIRYEVSYPYQYVLRLTPGPKGPDSKEQLYGVESIKEQLDIYSDCYVIGEEGGEGLAQQTHYHAYFESKLELKDIKYILQEYFLFKLYPVRKKGWGGAQYNLKKAKKPYEAICYAIKDNKNIFFKGIEEDIIEQAKEDAYHGKDINFKLEVRNLKEQFQKGTFTKEEFAGKIFDLHVKYERNIDFRHINNMMLTQLLKKEPELYRPQYVNRLDFF